MQRHPQLRMPTLAQGCPYTTNAGAWTYMYIGTTQNQSHQHVDLW